MLDKMDLHTHTIASGHAYNTRNEMIKAATEQGLEVYAITEHAPAMPGSCQSMYFMNYRVLPRKFENMTVLYGVELNIVDYAGHVDLPESILQEMDLALASIHTPCYTSGSIIENTNAYIGAMRNPYVILEVNNASLSPKSFRGNPREKYKEMLNLCIKYQVPIVMDSDAHVDIMVGNHRYAQEMLNSVDFPEELVINYHLEVLKDYLNYAGE